MKTSPWWKGARGEWYVVVQGVLLALVVLGPRGPAWPSPWGLALRVGGVAAAGLGAALAGAGMLHLGANLTALPHPKTTGTLVEQGAYAVVRHPIYSGLIFLSLGWALRFNGIYTLAYVAVLFVFFDVKARREERWLAEKYPGYANYRQRVRKLVPFVY